MKNVSITRTLEGADLEAFQGCEFDPRHPPVIFTVESTERHHLFIADDVRVELHVCDPNQGSPVACYSIESPYPANRYVLLAARELAIACSEEAELLEVLKAHGFAQIS